MISGDGDGGGVTQELDRLRAKYGTKAIKEIRSQFESFPSDYPEALDRGGKISLGVGGTVASHNL